MPLGGRQGSARTSSFRIDYGRRVSTGKGVCNHAKSKVKATTGKGNAGKSEALSHVNEETAMPPLSETVTGELPICSLNR